VTDYQQIFREVEAQHEQASRTIQEEFYRREGGDRGAALFSAIQQRGEHHGMKQKDIDKVHFEARKKLRGK
jgi:hypothetical protein